MIQSLGQAQGWYETLDAARAWTNERERRDVHFRIHNARGYGGFRYAFYFLADPDRYKKECDAAIEALDGARADRPDHYEVLQNLGMIYADSEYDPIGRFLPMAQELFERTKGYVPEDYYQYEQLAQIHWRRAATLQDKAQKKVVLEAGRVEARTAQARRAPDVSRRIMRLLSAIALADWRLPEPRDPIATNAIQAFKEAEPWCIEDLEFTDEYAGFLTELASVRESVAHLREVVAITSNLVTKIKAADQLALLKRVAEVLKAGTAEAQEAAAKLKATDRRAALKPVAEVLKAKAGKVQEAAAKLKDNDPTKGDRVAEAAEVMRVVTELSTAIGA